MRDTFFNYRWGMSGCIAKGIITYDKDRNIFLGQPIVDAYQTSEDLDFYGVVVHKTAIEAVCQYTSQKKESRAKSKLNNLFKEKRVKIREFQIQ